MIPTLALWSHAVCAFVFLAVAVLLLARPSGARTRFALGGVAGAIATWAIAVAVSLQVPIGGRIENWAEMVRILAVLGFALALLRRDFPGAGLARALEAGSAVLALCWAAALLSADTRMSGVLRIGGAILGLICLENILRNAAPDRRWALKFGVAGLALPLLYDVALHAASALRGAMPMLPWAARGLVIALGAPLLLLSAWRDEEWRLSLWVSRAFVFHTSVAVVSGLALILVALGAHYLRTRGGTLGGFAAITSGATLVVSGLAVAMSGAARSRLNNFLARHFFRARFDWRAEWLRFMATIAAGDEATEMPRRAVQAVADAADSPGGVLWLADARQGTIAVAATWNAATRPGQHALVHPSLLPTDAPLPAAEMAARLATTIPDLAEDLRDFWVVVPARHRLIDGFFALLPPRAPRRLGWEDYALLTTVGRQAASYLAADAALRQLVEMQRIESFNARFAFLVHDLKSMTSQLQLLVRNTDRHGDDPAFRHESLVTLRGLVGRMGRMLDQIAANRGSERDATFTIATALAPLVARWPRDLAVLGGEAASAQVRGDADRLTAALTHLVQNGIDASSGAGPVTLQMRRRGRHAEIEIVDRGQGMNAEFLQRELFAPFRSTKQGGFGIGAYQARALIRELGGTLAVASAPGEGTRFTITLPETS
jgi:putative PEP-CTERM system histidine kinase